MASIKRPQGQAREDRILMRGQFFSRAVGKRVSRHPGERRGPGPGMRPEVLNPGPGSSALAFHRLPGAGRGPVLPVLKNGFRQPALYPAARR